MLHFMLTLLLLFISLFTTIIGIIFMIMPAENWLLWPQQWLAGTRVRHDGPDLIHT
jgi:hypothetical protein